jgi:two-component system, response regulator PdtaR
MLKLMPDGPQNVPGQPPLRGMKMEDAPAILCDKKAVIVEDEAITQLQLRRILRLYGVDVVGMAGDGEEAVRMVLSLKPDLVLMDVRMPVMDGLEAADRILQQFQVCILMLTAFSEEEYLRRAAEVGACGYVIKPVTNETLLHPLVHALEEFSKRGERQ